MISTPFLEQLAAKLLVDNSQYFDNLTIVLPNKRARVFLIEAFKKQIDTNIFAPKIISIEDFIQDIAAIRSIDTIEILFEFFEVYSKIVPIDKKESFEQFANWAKIILQDFNEIDRYLLDPNHVLSYLKDIEDIKHWSVDADKRTKLIERYLKFYNLLIEYYRGLYSHLKEKKVGYQGLIYREAVANIPQFLELSDKDVNYVFAGFNALNAAEEVIIQNLIAANRATIFWDIDKAFVNDRQHDAGLFVRRFKDSWTHYKSNPFEWIFDDFSQEKNIKVIGTSKSIGQAKIVGSILEDITAQDVTTLNRVAVVLGDENLLLPVLHALPAKVDRLNITMGYSGKNNPVQILISKLFKMHSNALSRNAKSYVFYYKDVIDVLTHPLISANAEAESLVKDIRRNNFTFIAHQTIISIHGEGNDLFKVLFSKWDKGALDVLNNLSSLLLSLKETLVADTNQEKLTKAFIYSIYKVVNKISNYFSGYSSSNTIETLTSIYKQVIDLAEVSFEGEPLEGLQLMGVLETRVLDFDTVIITSMNEGKFPAGKSQNSFIPYDVKRELGLPTFKEKDAIYTYHFYHLLQRAKNVYLIYNTESEGMDGGEKSRFITQLQVEKKPLHTLSAEIYSPYVPEVAAKDFIIEKTESVMERLAEIASKGFSPSALTSYIRNPMQFYFQKILSIRDLEDVEENIALNTLGTIIHETLANLYNPLIGKVQTEEDIQICISKIDDEVAAQFQEIYKKGEIKKGRNLLAFEVAKRHILNFLKLELKAVNDGDSIEILFLEKRFERVLESDLLPYPIVIGGSVDRIELRNGVVRIIDYKTGKVLGTNLSLKNWDNLVLEIKNDKIIQVLAYAFTFEPFLQGRMMEAGVISFKNMKSGFLPFKIKEDKIETQIVTSTILEKYKEQLVHLLLEILNKDIPFTEKEVKSF